MINKLYKISPVFIQHILVTLYGFYWKNRRYGGVFKQKVTEFKQHESFSKEEWKTYQEKELKKLLIHSFKNVPYYRKKFAENGFKVSDIENFKLSDLHNLPFLEKEDLRKVGTSTLLSDTRKKGTFFSSSGSTGKPIKVYFNKEFHQCWSALYEARVRNWAGVNYKQSRAMIGGRRILPTSKIKPPFYRNNLAEKQAYFSAYHISIKTAKKYIEELLKLQPKYLVGYAKSIHLLALEVNKELLEVPKLLAVLTSSEKLTSTMRNDIEKAFNCKVFDGYSGVEACGLISENSYGELLFSPDSGILEVLDDEGNPVKEGEVGEAVFTGFLNYDQPLIRYRIGDRIKLAKNQISKSGMHMPIIEEIEGRIEDVIVGENGQKMVRFHGIFVDILGLIMAQVEQKSLNKIMLNLVVDDEYSKNSEEIMLNRIKSQLGEIEVTFNYVSSIENSKNGKYKAVISHIKHE